MGSYVFEPPAVAVVPVRGGGLFPVRRIFCIGRNYADHVKEMGGDAKSDSPVFFTKPADAVAPNGSIIPFPPATEDLHYEGELVVALKGGGHGIRGVEEARALVFGYAAGCDLTRRDLQAAAKQAGGPWDASKAFDRSAPVGEVMRAEEAGALRAARLKTVVNGQVRQDAALADTIWSIPEIIIELSRLFELKAGDLIFTGTPAGVGALAPGDRVEVTIGDLPKLSFCMDERA